MKIDKRNNIIQIELNNEELKNVRKQLSKVGLHLEDLTEIDYNMGNLDLDNINFSFKFLLINKINDWKRKGVLK